MRRDSNRSDSDDSDSHGGFARRQFLATASAGTLGLGLAGCLAGDDTGSSGNGSGGTGTDSGSGTGNESASGSGAGGAKSGGTLQWGGAVPVQGLDPHLDTAAASKRVLENIVEGLVRLQPDYTFEPLLAKEMTTSEDNTKLSFTLHEGVTFHNGEEMTSADVKASFERVQGNEKFVANGFMQKVDSMSAPSDYEFSVTLTEPFAPFIAKMSTAELAVLPAAEAEKSEIKEPIGTGPYQFDSREIESSFTMTKFEDYWGADSVEGPYIDKIVKSEITDPSVRLQSFMAGEYDFINGIPPKDVQRVQQDGSVRFEKNFPKSLVYLGLNCEEEPFSDKNARLALDYAFDKAEVAEAALYGTGQATASPATPGSPWVNEDVQPRPRDLDKAQEHLEKAGMPDGFSVSFKIPQSYPAQVQAAQVIADQASEAGIELNIQKITWSSWLSDVYSKQNFEATTSSYLALYYPDVSFYKFLHPDGAFFFTGWTNEEYNAKVEEARHLYDESKRAELYKEATQIMHDERAGHLLLFWQANLYGAQPDYKGKIGTPDGSSLRFNDNWLDR
ncbi:ABC transporter substrate-binding protein [Halobium salinum]|uniref:ABC transporter substrate-binding protein n=1 Tax=Halobium salinum TaxID=1364940 RepID=A0ABD5PBQ4_9EURY|nr:ABC transporter substrate-binding protein [Halobium salinum]